MTTTYGLTASAVAQLQDTLDFITANPERHNQGTWLGGIPVEQFENKVEPDLPNGCGTYGCVAGWLAMRNLGEIPAEALTPIYRYDYQAHEYTDQVVAYDLDYTQFEVAEVARRALGVGYGTDAYYQMDSLFNGDRTIEQIWFIANQLADGRLRIPDSITPADPDAYDPCPCGCEDDD